MEGLILSTLQWKTASLNNSSCHKKESLLRIDSMVPLRMDGNSAIALKTA
jgi:hypothetical protein